MMKLEGKNIAVVGLGRSGVAAAALCVSHGAHVIATDKRPPSSVQPDVFHLETMGVQLVLGGHDNVPWTQLDMVVISPGVPSFRGIQEAEQTGASVIGELELSCRFVNAPIAIIGGTNGKSTVTSWVGEMAKSLGHVFVGGNLGTPLAERAHENFDCIVLEVSSFQAERVPTLHPRVAALLNISDDHLDRYDCFEDYANAKGNVFVNMQPDDTVVIPAGDPLCAQQAARGKGKVITFGPGGDVERQGSWIVDRIHAWRFPCSAIVLPGQHNILNACAAIGMAGALGAKEKDVLQALSGFTGLDHRMQLAGVVKGVSFYNDSKGTNVGASVAALRGLHEPKAVLIAGGRDKQGSYEPLVQAMAERGRAIVLIGEAADRIEKAMNGVVPVVRAKTMDDAVAAAFEAASQGDAVLLSPACSSYDMFKDYQERGDAFHFSVAELKKALEEAL